MGGSFFASGNNPLDTPRMPLDIYHKVKKQCIATLSQHFKHVASAIDGPAKTDFGDIDILVASREEVETDVDSFTLINQVLSAVAWRKDADDTAHYAISWPVGPDLDKSELGANCQPKFIQVDVRVCASPEKLQWMLFKHGHGDLWNILGSTIRPYGLTADEECLSIRIPDIERANRKLAKVKLTSNPREILEFLGLPYTGYWEGPFEKVDDLYEYVAMSPFFWVQPAAEGEEKKETQVEKHKEKMTSNDRRRMKSRHVFARWIEEFLPRCRAEGRALERKKTRDSVREEVFAKFDVKTEYRTRLRSFAIKKQQHEINVYIKSYFSNPEEWEDELYRGCAIKGLKRCLIEEETMFGIVPTKRLKADDGTFIIENVREFVDSYHDNVARAQLAEHNSKSKEWIVEKEKKNEGEEKREGEEGEYITSETEV